MLPQEIKKRTRSGGCLNKPAGKPEGKESHVQSINKEREFISQNQTSLEEHINSHGSQTNEPILTKIYWNSNRLNVDIKWPREKNQKCTYQNSINYNTNFPTIEESLRRNVHNKTAHKSAGTLKQQEEYVVKRHYVDKQKSDDKPKTNNSLDPNQLTECNVTPDLGTQFSFTSGSGYGGSEERRVCVSLPPRSTSTAPTLSVPAHRLTCTTRSTHASRPVLNEQGDDTHVKDTILTVAQASNLATVIDEQHKKSSLRHYNLSKLINTGKKESRKFKEDIFDILFQTETNNFKSLSISVRIPNNESIIAVLDSGSAENILNAGIAHRLNLHLNHNDLPTLIAANDQKVNVLGKTEMLLKIDNMEFMTTFIIVNDLPVQMLLGNRFLSNSRCLLDYENALISLNKNDKTLKIPMNKEWILDLRQNDIMLTQETNNEIRISEELVIAPKQHYKFKQLTKEEETSDFVMNNNLRENKRLNIYISTEIENNETKKYLNIFNPSKVNRWLKKNTLLGSFSHIQSKMNKNDTKKSKGFAKLEGAKKQNSYSPPNPEKRPILDNNGDPLNINPQLTVEQHNKLANMLQNYIVCFTNRTQDLTEANIPPVRLRVKDDASPFFTPPFRQSKQERLILNNEVKKLLDADVLTEADGYTEFCSPLFVATNSDGTKRVLSDLRKLNQILLKDNHPMPSCDLVFSCLSNSKFFSRLDLKNAFFQIPIHKDDQHLLTVATQSNKYCWKRLPQGCSLSSIIFQREITKILSKYLYDIAIPYIDDICLRGTTFEEKLHNLELVLKELKKFNLKLNTAKSQLMYQEINLLGHKISDKGILPLDTSIQAIVQIPIPKKIKDLRSFLGAANFFRKHIEGFAKISLPLTEAIKTYNKEKRFEWTRECTTAFLEIKRKLSTPPLLGHFHEDRITNIHCDSSDFAIGGVITQIDETTGLEVPIQYISRKLKPSETKWSISEKEFLSLTYIVTRFREFTFGRTVHVYTDHYSLKYYKNFKPTSVRLTRLAMLLTDYELEIHYKPGITHQLPDMLSRNPEVQETIEEDLITINLLHEVDLRTLQSEDDKLKPIILAIKNPTAAKKKYITIAKDYKIQHGILYRKYQKDQLTKYVIALPKSLHKTVLEEFHDSKMSGAHLNSFKVLKNLQDRFHWFGMRKDTENYVKTCEPCQKRKYIPKKPYGLFQGILPTNKVFERLQTDVIGPLISSNKYKYILTVTEATTRYGFAFPLITADSKSIAKCLITLFCTFGVTEIIQSDVGTEFASSIIQQLNLALGTCHIFASSYSPHVMGQIERLNGTLCTCISHYVHNSPNQWSKYLPYVLFAYNNSVNQVTGYRPAYLLHGFNPRLPSDTIFITPQADKDLLENLQIVDEIRNTIPNIIKQQQVKQKKYYDKTRREMPELAPGTEVLIAYPKIAQLNPSKFSQKYKGPAIIIKKATPVSYVCEFLKYGKLTQEVVHVSRMKLYHSRQIP